MRLDLVSTRLQPLGERIAISEKHVVRSTLVWRGHRFGLWLNSYPGDQAGSSHAHDYSNVSLVLNGSLEECSGFRRASAVPLDVVIKPRGTEHRTWFGRSGARLLQLQFDPADAPEDRDPMSWMWIRQAKAVKRLFRLWKTAHGASSETDIECAALEVLEVLGEAIERKAIRASWLARVQERIDDTFMQSLKVSELAREVSVHPVYLTRCFRATFGCGVASYIRGRRLSAAAEWLAGSGVPIAAVAARAGFADQSHLTRAFRLSFGVTPAIFRHLAS